MPLTLKVKRFNDLAILPTKAHFDDAGFDLYTPFDFTLFFGGKLKINTLIGIQPIPYTVGLILDRSSMGDKGIKVLGGVIDNYIGEIYVILSFVGLPLNEDGSRPINASKIDFKRGDKIAQLVIVPVVTPREIEEVTNLKETERGSKGFGSSGR